MFCPDCGSKIEDPNQNFCPNCGRKIPRVQETPQPEPTYQRPSYQQPTYQPPTPNYSYQRPSTTSSQAPPPTNYQSPPSTTYRSPYPQPRVKPVGDPERFSKISLGLAIPSAIFIIIGLYAGFFTFMFTRSGYFGLIPWIGVLVVHSIGLIFGIISVVNAKKAERLELANAIQKAGNVIGILGLIFNSILLAVGIFFMLTTPIGPLYL